jgi:hypothetical protein
MYLSNYYSLVVVFNGARLVLCGMDTVRNSLVNCCVALRCVALPPAWTLEIFYLKTLRSVAGLAQEFRVAMVGSLGVE